MTSITVRIVPARGDAFPAVGLFVLILTAVPSWIILTYFVPWNGLVEVCLETLIILGGAALTRHFRDKINERVLGGAPQNESYKLALRHGGPTSGVLRLNAPPKEVVRLPDGGKELIWEIQN